MTLEEFIEYINSKLYPYKLRENGKSVAAGLYRKYSQDLLLECIDISIAQYFQYDEDGNLTAESAQNAFNKLSGILYNKSRNPIDQEIYHIKKVGRKTFDYWNESKCEECLIDYVKALRNADWTDEQILSDLKTEVKTLLNSAYSWSNWYKIMQSWIQDIYSWDDDDEEQIQSFGTIIPETIIKDIPLYAQKLIKQINSSYENNLYDCCAVMMRRLLENLLVLSFQRTDTEEEIMDKSGKRHVTLDKIIQIAENSKALALSANTKKDMKLFKDLGNFSAHKIWYNCTEADIEPHILKYRVIIEELLYKSGLK